MGDMKTINILRANICIFIGAILNAAAGTMARFLGISNTFWLIMALGWIVLFMGVLLAGHRSKIARTASTSDKETTPLNV